MVVLLLLGLAYGGYSIWKRRRALEVRWKELRERRQSRIGRLHDRFDRIAKLLAAVRLRLQAICNHLMQLWARLRDRGKHVHVPGIGRKKALPQFNVVALGTQGAGKTVFLACLFNEFMLHRPGRPFTLQAPTPQRQELGSLYADIVNTGADWPEGTSRNKVKEFTLRCVSHDRGARHDMFDLSYIDFGGELVEPVTGSPTAALAALDRHLGQADAVFGMLDGVRLADFVNGGTDGFRYVHAEVNTLIGHLSVADCPIHLIVSKWDLVRDIGEPKRATDEERLSIVRRALLGVPNIEHLVNRPVETPQSIRLIPVSSVGDGFAKLTASGHVAKRKGATIESVNLEVPLASVIPDCFDQLEHRLAAADLETIRNHAQSGWSPTEVKRTWKILSVTAQALIQTAMAAPPAALVAGAADLFFSWTERPVAAVLTKPDTTSTPTDDGHIADSASRSRARDAMLDSFDKSVWRLERDVPSSVLRAAR